MTRVSKKEYRDSMKDEKFIFYEADIRDKDQIEKILKRMRLTV